MKVYIAIFRGRSTPNNIRCAAVLEKSMLSGVVAGLGIYEIKDQQLGDKILYIDNHKGIDLKLEELFNSMNN